MQPRILSVSILPGHCISISFNDGRTVVKDLQPVIAIGNLAADLTDDDFLRQVQIGERGRSLGWPNGLEFCADALWLEGKEKSRSRRVRSAALSVKPKSITTHRD